MGDDQESPAATVPLGAYVPVLMYEQLREAAREQDRSMSAVIRKAIAAELQREAEAATS